MIGEEDNIKSCINDSNLSPFINEPKPNQSSKCFNSNVETNLDATFGDIPA